MDERWGFFSSSSSSFWVDLLGKETEVGERREVAHLWVLSGWVGRWVGG